jgi:hypothetical protein
MSHHYSGPNFGFPLEDARLDLTDLYAFPKPGDEDKSILIMNVHPSSTLINPTATTSDPFDPDGMYELKMDTNGDAVADIAYRIRFSLSPSGRQVATVRRETGSPAAGTDDGGDVVFLKAPVSIGRDAQISEAGGHRFFAGWRSECFFFDTLGAINDLKFTGSDFFLHKNVCSIVLEVPNSALGSSRIDLWARTLAKRNGSWMQLERGARPQQAVFLPGEHRDAYMAAEPADDTQFVAVFAHALEHTGGYQPEEAVRVAKTLLPDVMPYDPTRPACFPDNGRSLTDDAADAFMVVLTNGKIAGDGVGPHSDLLAEFPYLGPPHDVQA